MQSTIEVIRAQNQQNRLKIQEDRISIISKTLENQLKVIQVNKLALSEKYRKTVTELHDLLKERFEVYIKDVTQFIKLQNDFKDTNVIQKKDECYKEKLSLKDTLQALLEAKSKEQGEVVFIPNPSGFIEFHMAESQNQKKLQAKADQVSKQLESVEQDLKRWTKRAEQFDKECEKIKTQTKDFQTNCKTVIDVVSVSFEHQGNWQAIFNYLVSLISAISSVFQSLHIKSTAEKVLDSIKFNIDVAIEKAEHINLYEAEYFGLITNQPFKPL
jgi:hypothetical protein